MRGVLHDAVAEAHVEAGLRAVVQRHEERVHDGREPHHEHVVSGIQNYIIILLYKGIEVR